MSDSARHFHARPGTATLLAVGDVALRTEQPEQQLERLAPLLREGDVTFGQLEGLLSSAGTNQLFPGFRGRSGDAVKDPDAGARILATAGFDVMSLAGNHSLDRGPRALVETRDAARDAGIGVIGAGPDEDEARAPYVTRVGGTTVGFLGYCSVTPRRHEATPTRTGVAPLRARTLYEQVDWQPGSPPRIVTDAHPADLDAMVSDISRLRSEVDVLVLSMHWGIHFEPGSIADYQYEAGHAAVDAGADLVLGHHGHVVQGIEWYRGAPIFYSIGNVTLVPRDEKGRPVTPGAVIDAQRQMVVRVEVADGSISRVSAIPVWLDARLEPEPLASEDPRFGEFVDYLRRVCDLPSTPRNPWEVLYLEPAPPSRALRSTRFVVAGDMVDILPAGCE